MEISPSSRRGRGLVHTQAWRSASAARYQIIAAVIASFVAAPAIHRALELANKQPSSAEISVESTRSLARYGAAMRLVAVLLTGTAALMAVARYL